jgi:hypothetical protein
VLLSILLASTSIAAGSADLGLTVPSVAAGATTSAATSGLTFTHMWTAGATGALNDTGGPIAKSSPNLATLGTTGPSVVVGDRAGRVYAFHLSTGTEVAGWPASTGAPVTSTPSVAPLGGSDLDSVFVGSGNAADPAAGGYQAFGPGGNQLWFSAVTDPGTDSQPAYGVQASLSLGALQGAGPDVVAGSLDQEEYALNATDGSSLAGWPFFTSDSVFSTAALADLYGTGHNEIIEGGAQTGGFADGQTYPQGGHLRIMSGQGGLICHYDTNQDVYSSPAVGAFLGSSTEVGIVFGTGTTFTGIPSQTDQVMAIGSHCDFQWSTTLDGSTASSPALADVTGTGALAVVEGTETSTGGSVYVLTGTTGTVEWSATTTGKVIGSVVAADLTGQGYQDLLVPTTQGVDIFDGRTHQLVHVLNGVGTATYGVLGFQNSPLVTDDPDGAIGITVAGYRCTFGPTECFGQVEHYEITGSDGALAVGSGSWPEFHHDAQLTGNAGGSAGSTVPCAIPSAALSGYDEVASDGGIFSFGAAPFCGSTGGLTLNAPIVGMAMAPTTGGYWMVASDGGIFAFGDAQFYGSMGGKPLNQPIVGMAATPDGKGYWLVASDGGIFAFGDAHFYGSTGSLRLNAPIVGIAATADGAGYRLVASDGGIFAFGDAQFFGSMGGQPLNAPIVGMAEDAATGGYWMVAADGGVFSFLAPFLGSMGGQRLAAPIVGLSPTQNGYGYRFVAADGGIFTFGSASFSGSMGGRPLNKPVVGMVAF